jgi:DNA helicase-2/ATP-dependent DNA helicase PcrA
MSRLGKRQQTRTTNALGRSIIASLSGEQQKAFERKTRNACILAAAGSGKTRTLVRLLAADLARGVHPENIICFTFTEKAAEELLARIHNLVRREMPSLDIHRLSVGTIHSWCLQYLAKQADFLNYTPTDELQVNALVSRLYDFLELDKTYDQTFPLGIDSFLKDLEIFYNEHLSLDQVPAAIRKSIDKFLNTLYTNRMITFGGMVRSTIEYLRTKGPLPSPCSLFVDEYQDVNPAQVELIKAMLPKDSQLVVVGDDLQCIYNWRGSDVRRILDFQDEFIDSDVFRLNTNYRSRPEIVDVGNRIGDHISLRDPQKRMKAERSSLGTPTVHWIVTDSVESQTAAVVDIVNHFVRVVVPRNKIAILLRSVLGSGRPIVEGLRDNGVPVQCPVLNRGGQFINDFVIPIFEWLRHEHHEPRNELEFGEAEIASNMLWASIKGWLPESFSELRFWEKLHFWLRDINDGKNAAYDIRGRFYEFTDACGVRIAAGDSDLAVGFGVASQIIRGVEEVHRRRLLGQTRRSPRAIMNEAYFALIRQKDDFGESTPIDTNQDAVLVSTVHQAKGLEWPIVIMPNLLSKRFPVNPKGHDTSFPDNIAARYGTTLDDERRLFFVAATRARERLFFIDGAGVEAIRRSIFLKELNKHGILSPCALKNIPSDVWKIAEKDLKEKDQAPLRIGLSDLLIYFECPYQFGLRRIVGVQPSVGEELGYGKSLHELIQRRSESASPWTESELKRYAEKHVFMPYTSAESEKKSRKTIIKRLERLEYLGAFVGKSEAEISVELLLGPGIVYGIIDCARIRPDGSVTIVDWKSGIHEKFLPRYVRQLQFYAFALQKRGIVISAADIVDVGASDEQGKLVTYAIDIGQANLKKLITELSGCMNGIKRCNFLANPAQITCSACDMYYLCGERWQNDKIAKRK